MTGRKLTAADWGRLEYARRALHKPPRVVERDTPEWHYHNERFTEDEVLAAFLSLGLTDPPVGEVWDAEHPESLRVMQVG